MRKLIVYTLLLICSFKLFISAKLLWTKYDITKDKRISNAVNSVTSYSAGACCEKCRMSGRCNHAAYNKERRVCEQSKLMLGNISSVITETGWTLYTEMCPLGWELFDNSCFFLETRNLSWSAAQENCNSKTVEGHLVSIKTEERNNFIISLINKTYTGGRYRVWIGGNYGDSDTFYWRDGTSLNSGFTYWAKTQPQLFSGIENCVLLRSHQNFTWRNVPCSKPEFSMCEKALF